MSNGFVCVEVVKKERRSNAFRTEECVSNVLSSKISFLEKCGCGVVSTSLKDLLCLVCKPK